MPGGVGSASARDGDVVIGALAVVNAVGDVIGADGPVLAGSTAPDGTSGFPHRRAVRAHDACGDRDERAAAPSWSAVCSPRARITAWPGPIHPSHTRHDGDVAFAVATGEVEVPQFDRLRVLATEVTAEAVRAAVT